MNRGAWKPGRMDVEIEHTFVDARDRDWAREEVARIVVAGRTPLVTVEPNVAPGDEMIGRWADGLRPFPFPVYVRYMHEMNGTWYPWGGDPKRFRREWARWAVAMPGNVRNVWCPNVSFPGSKPVAEFWPDPKTVDVIGLDGYARNGESMADVFAPTLEELHAAGILRHNKPLMIAETGTPRGRGQAKWWKDGMAWAERQGIAAVVAFSEDKSHLGGDERDWSMSKAAQRAFLGEPRRREGKS